VALLDFEADPFTFIEAFETACVDGGIVYKHIRAVLALDKSEPFLVVEPFDSSVLHADIPLSSIKFSKSSTEGSCIGK
jgi:hypothetical protein